MMYSVAEFFRYYKELATRLEEAQNEIASCKQQLHAQQSSLVYKDKVINQLTSDLNMLSLCVDFKGVDLQEMELKATVVEQKNEDLSKQLTAAQHLTSTKEHPMRQSLVQLQAARDSHQSLYAEHESLKKSLLQMTADLSAQTFATEQVTKVYKRQRRNVEQLALFLSEAVDFTPYTFRHQDDLNLVAPRDVSIPFSTCVQIEKTLRLVQWTLGWRLST